MSKRTCPALAISAPASNQGKTTVVAGLAYYHRKHGRRVQVFKTGPDFLDPMILERASGNKVHQLDLWMTGQADCRELLYRAAGTADLILVEGVMGLFDGTPSTADLAVKFNLPVVAVIDASKMAQTFQAVAHGLATFRKDLTFAGVIANKVASPRHKQLLAELPPSSWQTLSHLPSVEGAGFPERHLGLVQAEEIADLDHRLDILASLIAETPLSGFLPEVEFDPAKAINSGRWLDGQVIGIARDAAFSFLYPANLDLLEEMGARLKFFSPLSDTAIPDCNSLYLPGGYPELHLDTLSSNQPMKAALRKHFQDGKPIYAECGGMLYLFESLTDKQGHKGSMAGLIEGHAIMQKKLSGLGFQSVATTCGSLRGHTFHHSLVSSTLKPSSYGTRAYDQNPGEALFKKGMLWASYLHLYFRSNPKATAQLFLGQLDPSPETQGVI